MPGRPNVGLGNQGGGKDDISGYNTHSFVLQVPEAEVTRDGRAVAAADSSNAVVGVWATTERKRLKVLRHKGKKKHVKASWVQVSRLGNPLINEVIVPIGAKDKFNRTGPARRRGELRRLRRQPRAGAAAQRAVRPRHQGDGPHGHRPGAPHRRAGPDADRLGPGARRHAQAEPRRRPVGDREPLRRARERPRRLPERPPARRRRDGHRAARDRRRAAARRPGRQADPARRRRGPQRQAVQHRRSPTSPRRRTGSPGSRSAPSPPTPPFPQPPTGG